MSSYMDYRIRRFNHKKAIQEGKEPLSKFNPVAPSALSSVKNRFEKLESESTSEPPKLLRRRGPKKTEMSESSGISSSPKITDPEIEQSTSPDIEVRETKSVTGEERDEKGKEQPDPEPKEGYEEQPHRGELENGEEQPSSEQTQESEEENVERIEEIKAEDIKDISAKVEETAKEAPHTETERIWFHSDEDLRWTQVVVICFLALASSLVISTFFNVTSVESDELTTSYEPLTMFEKMPDASILTMTDSLSHENDDLVAEIGSLQEINLDPIKIKGKDGARSRQLREQINLLINENEELRLSVGRLWLNEQPEVVPEDRASFTDALAENHKLRAESEKLRHLGADLLDLERSVQTLQEENHALRIAFADFKYQKVPLPWELDPVFKETQSIARQVLEASRKRKAPPNLPNAKHYVTFMGQVLSKMSAVHEFGEANMFGKLDIATDIFTELVPKPSNIPPPVEEKLNFARKKFQEIKEALVVKWKQLKSLSDPENIRAVGRNTLDKMNRVLVNVVGKLKDIGQVTLLRRGKTPIEKTATALADSLEVLDAHFDHTWNEIEAEVKMDEVDVHLAKEMMEDNETPLPEEKESVKPTETSKEKTTHKKVVKTQINKKSTKIEQKEKDKTGKQLKKDKRNSDVRALKKESKVAKRISQDTKGKKQKGEKNIEAKKPSNKTSLSEMSRPDKEKIKHEQKSSDSKSEEKDGYFKGHYNKGKIVDKDVKERPKHFKRSAENDVNQIELENADIKLTGLKKHWEKPVKQNLFRESTTARQFIRRKGKEEKSFGVSDSELKNSDTDGDYVRDASNSQTKSKEIKHLRRSKSLKFPKRSFIESGFEKCRPSESMKYSYMRRHHLGTDHLSCRQVGAKGQIHNGIRYSKSDRHRDGHSDNTKRNYRQTPRTVLRRQLNIAQNMLKEKRAERRLQRVARKQHRYDKDDWRKYKRNVHARSDDRNSDFDDDNYDFYKNSHFFKRKLLTVDRR